MDWLGAIPALVLIVVVSVSVLLPVFVSSEVLATVAAFVIIEPLGVLALTWTTKVKVAIAPPASEAVVALIVPVLPTAVESVRVQPAGVVKETNVVLAGRASLRATFAALALPVLLTVMV